MKRAALAAALAFLFYAANRGAYQGFFSDDDLDTLLWTPVSGWDVYYEGVISPKASPHNFRPTGHLLYRLLWIGAGFQFPAWVAAIQALHLANCVLLWFVLRKLSGAELPALAGALFFSFHPALFDAFWKPMFLFELSCGLFCLLSILGYIHGRTVLALIAFWLAMKSKEIAILLPAALAVYELLLGERRWKRLLPFFAISLLFGTQALLLNSGQKGAYRMTMGLEAAYSTAAFYAGKVFCSHWTCAGLAVILLPALITRDRRVLFGLSAAALLLLPMLFFPGRALAVYWYVPLAGVAIALAAAASNFHPLSYFAVLGIWLVFSYSHLREYRKAELTYAADAKSYVAQANALASAHPEWTGYLYDGSPPSLHSWGVEAVWRHAAKRDLPVRHFSLEEGWIEPRSAAVPVVTWDNPPRKLTVSAYDPSHKLTSFVRMERPEAVFQLGRGWHGVERGARRMGARVTARLAGDPEASIFRLAWRIPDISKAEKLDLVVSFNGAEFGRFPCDRDGEYETTWPVAKPSRDPVEVALHVETAAPQARVPAPEQLVWIASFGFEREAKATMDRSARSSGELARVAAR